MSTAERTAPVPTAAPGLRGRIRPPGGRLEDPRLRRGLWALSVVGLTAFAAVHRLRTLGAPLWIDEGISLGVSSHPFTDIPSLLRQDGSPPLYYLLLHLWTSVFGATGEDGHRLSALFAVLGVPAAAWAAWRPWGALAGVIAAALAAFSPFVGLYADELRMYSLAFLLAALATGAFVRAFVIGGRRWSIAFGVLTAALMLTHGWGVLFAVSGAVAFGLVLAFGEAERRRALLVDGAIALAVVVVLFAAWIPTLLFQAAHTGAPWSHVPHVHSLELAFTRMFSGRMALALLVGLGGLGMALAIWRGPRVQRVAFAATVVLALGTLLGGYVVSKVGTPAWATRYLMVVLGALVVPLAGGLSRLGVVGLLVAVVVCIPVWALKPSDRTLARKSNVMALARTLGHQLPTGSLVLSPQPDEVPVVRYYLGPGHRYVTPLGLQRDDRVVDWVDALERARASRVETTLAPAVGALRPGERLLLVEPRFSHPDSPWTRLAQRRGREWRDWLASRAYLRPVAEYRPRHLYSRATVAGLVLERRRVAPSGRYVPGRLSRVAARRP